MSPRYRPWSLRRRIALVSAALSTVPAAIATLVGVTWLSQAVDAELRTLVREEIEEVRGELKRSPTPAADLEQFAPRLAGAHPDIRMAFRLVDLAGNGTISETISECGDEVLVDRLPPPDSRGEIHFVADPPIRRPDPDLFLADVRLRDDLGLTLLLDGARHRDRIARYWYVGLATSGLALLLGIIAAHLLSRRLRAMLTQVTEDLEARDEIPARSRLPEELAPVRERLRSMLDAARERADRTKVFTAGLAHELRSPLQNLIGEAEVTLLRERDRDTYRALAERQLQEHHELARAVDNVLHACAADEPDRRPHRVPFSMADECTVRLQAERQLAAARGIELRFDSSGPTDLVGDPEAMARVLRNLINNAIHWSPDGGRVHVLLHGTDQELRIEVHDAGPGVPVAERERIFVPFETNASPAGRRAGFGLGLAIARTAVHQHGGTIDVGDSPMGGASFTVVLPRSRQATADQDPGPASPGAPESARNPRR